MLLSRLLFASVLSLVVLPSQAAEFVRAFGTFPTDVIPLGMVAGPDGCFYGISGTGTVRQGASFRVASDNGKFEMTHQFKTVGPSPAFNYGGSMPDGVPLFATGCTYGLAKRGGLYGHGVLFQVWADGTFATIDLDPSQLPPDLPMVGETFVDSLSGLFEGSDRSIYSYHLAGALIRIGRDGMISKVASIPHPGTAHLNYPDPVSKDRIFSVSANLSDGGQNQNRIHLLQVRLSDAAILKEVSSPDFAADPDGVTALPSDLGLLVHVADGSSAAISGKLYRFDEDSGALTELATFGRPDNPALPPRMHKFIHASADGSIYYSTSSQRTGSIAVPDGRTLIELKPDGSFRTICGFGDHSMFNMVAKDGYLFGATHGTEVYIPKDQSGYQEEWMGPANAANYEIVNGSKKGGFHFQVATVDPALLNPPLVTMPDLIRPGLSEITIIRPLLNDRGRRMQLLSVEDPLHGYFYDIFDNRFMYRIGVYSKGNTVAAYQIGDRDSQTATGVVFIQGTVATRYQDPELPIGRRPFTISMKKTGNFTAMVPTGSGDRTVKISGKIDWRNQGLAGARLPNGEVITLHLDVNTPWATPTGVDYRIRRGDGTIITGRATLVGRR